jgi:hypothetical protein
VRESAGRDMRPNDRAATSWLHPAPGPEGRSGAGETRKLNSTDTFCRALWTPGSEKQRLAGLLDDDCCLLPAACCLPPGAWQRRPPVSVEYLAEKPAHLPAALGRRQSVHCPLANQQLAAVRSVPAAGALSACRACSPSPSDCLTLCVSFVRSCFAWVSTRARSTTRRKRRSRLSKPTRMGTSCSGQAPGEYGSVVATPAVSTRSLHRFR